MFDSEILVLGSLGQLGSELCRQYGPRAVGLDLPEFDLTDGQQVRRVLGERKPAAVINAAAYTQVDRAEEEPQRARAVNALGVKHLAEACQQLGAVLVEISTDYVFHGPASRASHGPGCSPFRETDQPNPQGVYAKTKWEGEQYARRCPRHIVARTAGLYGKLSPRSAGNFVETMLRLARANRPIRVVDDQRLSPTYTRHLARAVRFLLDAEQYGTFHLVNSGSTTWYGLAKEVFRLRGLSPEVVPIRGEPDQSWSGTTRTMTGPARQMTGPARQITGPARQMTGPARLAPRPGYSVLETSKYRALPGSPALPSWQSALGEYLRSRQP